MNKYSLKKLSEICEIIAWQSPLWENYNQDWNWLPFYQWKKDFWEKYIWEPTVWTTQITKEALENDILMSVRAPVWPINFATQNICIGRGLAAIRSWKSIDKVYLFYFLLSIQDKISGNTWAVFDSINKQQIGDIQIPLPPLPEQLRIISILDETLEELDQAKENIETNLRNAKEVFNTYLLGILTNPKYSIRMLWDLCESVEYGSSAKSKSMGKIPVLRMWNIQDGRFDWGKLMFSDNEEEIEKYSLKFNDVLFNRTNSPELVGKTAIYKWEMPAIFAGYLIRVNRKEELLDAEYLTYFLNSSIAKDYWNTVVISSVNQANINGTKLKSYPIPTPSLEEQKSIVSQLNSLSIETKRLEFLYQQKLTHLDELRKSLLQKAFNGEL